MIQTQLAPVSQLESVLPRLLNDLSVGRAQIAIDQIRTAVHHGSLDKLLFAVASHDDAPDVPIAATIAIQSAEAVPGEPSDTVTVIHSGWISDSDAAALNDVATGLRVSIDTECRRRGVLFLQWATDPTEGADDPVSIWCRALGFVEVATLDYLAGEVAEPSAEPKLRFVPMDWNQPDSWQRFAQIVEQTYVDTLDCPRLAQYRTAEQTLRGYQTSNAFDPSQWYFVYDEEELAGCLVLANHRATAEEGTNGTETSDPSSVIEIVYMGLIPSARGRHRAIEFMQHSYAAARRLDAARIILAVDRNNRPARATYDRAGLQPMLSETIWVKSLDPTMSAPTPG